MSAVATEQQNNGDVAAVEKVAANDAAVDAAAVKEDLKSKPAVEETKTAAADNGTASKEAAAADGEEKDVNPTSPVNLKEQVLKGTKRPSDAKSAESKKARKEKAADADSDEDDEVLDEEIIDSDVESDEYDIPYGGEEDDDIECDGDDDYDDGSGSDEQA